MVKRKQHEVYPYYVKLTFTKVSLQDPILCRLMMPFSSITGLSLEDLSYRVEHGKDVLLYSLFYRTKILSGSFGNKSCYKLISKAC